MSQFAPYPPIDYLVIGHLTRDLVDNYEIIGGTAAYSALTAKALGLRPGIVTSWGEDLPLGKLIGIPIVNIRSEDTTTFKNVNTDQGRTQLVISVASELKFQHIPEEWLNANIVHLGPVANEINLSMVQRFSSSLIGITPQGWLRQWDRQGNVRRIDDLFDISSLYRSGAVVVSMEDVVGDETWIESLANVCRVLAVTEGSLEVRIYWHGDVRRFKPADTIAVDTTGAGDIFATAFFTRLYTTRDPWEAARFATKIATISVTRSGLDSVPSEREIQECMLEIF